MRASVRPRAPPAEGSWCQAQGDAYDGTMQCTQTMCRRYSVCHASAPDVRRGDGVGSWSKCALIERPGALATPDSPSFPPPRWLARIAPRARTSTLFRVPIALLTTCIQTMAPPAVSHCPAWRGMAVETTLLLLLLRRLFGLTSTTSTQIRRKLVIVGQCGSMGTRISCRQLRS